LIVAGTAAVFLFYPPQTREIYRALAEDLFGNLLQLALSLVSLCVASVAFSLIARDLLSAETVPKSPGSTRRLIPILCAALIPGGLSIGLYLAAGEAQIGKPPEDYPLSKMPELIDLLQSLKLSRINLLLGGILCTIITASLLIPNVGFRSLWVRKFFARLRLRTRHFAIVGVICLIFFSIFSVTGSKLVGPIGIFLFAVIGSGAVVALLTRAGDRCQLPLFSGVIVVAVLLSFLDLTDNHVIALIDSNAARHNMAVDSFEKWYESRRDRSYYETRKEPYPVFKEPYPVFIVAASGGGLYAAHHAATVLSRLQDQCPSFAQHVFAISGVSGGSVGGALFSSLAKKHAQNGEHIDCLAGERPNGARSRRPHRRGASARATGSGGTFEQRINQFLDTDFLSPVLGAALFPDAVQRFFPAVTSRFDRARAFESTLAGAWSKLYPEETDNPWSKPFLEHWDPAGAAPALVLAPTSSTVIVSRLRPLRSSTLARPRV
jgi:hypothetical protein